MAGFAAGFVAAESGDVPDIGVVPGAIALSLALLMGLGMVWLATTTRPRRAAEGASTMDLRPESPAVVDMLTGGFEVEDDAVPATVVDLAARGWFTIEDAGGERIILRLRQHGRRGDTLTEYEQRVLRHVERHAVDGVVPAPVLTLGPQGVSKRWVRGFVREVTADGRQQGLCRRRWDPVHVAAAWVLVVLASAPGGILVALADRTTDPTAWGSLGNLLMLTSFVVAALLLYPAQRISRSDAQADTPAGLEAAAHWMGVRTFYREHGRFQDKGAPSVAIWERNLAYATALGLAPLVERQIPFETEHDKHAWSRATGQWRRVRVRYRSFRPGRGRHPALVAFLGLVLAVVFGVVAYGGYYVAGVESELQELTPDARRTVGLVGLAVASVAAVACAYSVVTMLLGLSDLFARRTVEGELVRKRMFYAGLRMPHPLEWLARFSSDSRRRKWYLAIDAGDAARITAFSVRPSIHDSVQQGARVRATFTPRLRYVRSIETVAPPHGGPSDEGVGDHVSIDDVIGEVGGPLATALGTLPAASGIGALGHILDTLTGDGRADLEGSDDAGQPDAGRDT